MSNLLRWRPADPPDRRLRHSSTCAEPAGPAWDGTRRSHPAWYELEVQSWLRSHRVRPEEMLLLGLDGGDIGAMVSWAVGIDPSDVLLQALAVAVRHRHRGGDHAREAMTTALRAITTAASRAGARDVLVEARIRSGNQPSKTLCLAAGFRHVDDLDPDLERWTLYETF